MKPIEIVKSVDLGFGVVELRSDSILTFVPIQSAQTINIDQLEEMLLVLIDLADGNPKPFYADNSHVTNMGFRERQYIGKNLHRFAAASGVKYNSDITRSIGNTILAMFPPKVPMKMFASEEDAFEWLQDFGTEE